MPKRIYHDEQQHEQHIAFLRARAQAHYRKEGWSLTVNDYFEIWADCWSQRGRSRDDLVLTRIDHRGDWDRDNVEIVTRYEQLLRKFVMKGCLRSHPDYQKTTYRPRKKNVQS